MGKHYSRRRYVVDWKLQGSLCMHGLLYGALVLFSIAAGIFMPLLWDLGGSQGGDNEEQAIVMVYLHERLWLLVLVCAVVVVVSAIKMSHRIAGPLVRYKRNLRLVADGKLPTPLRTRPGDYLQEEVTCLNAAVAGIAARVDAIQAASSRVLAEVAALAAPAPGQVSPSLEALLAASRELEQAVAAIVRHDPGDERDREPVREVTLVLAGAGE